MPESRFPYRYFQVLVIHEGGVVSKERNLVIGPDRKTVEEAMKTFRGGRGVGNNLTDRCDACRPEFKHSYEVSVAEPVLIVEPDGKIHG